MRLPLHQLILRRIAARTARARLGLAAGLALALAVALTFAGGPRTTGATGAAGADAAKERARVLVFTKTAGFRHDSIPAGVEAIEELSRRHGIDVRASEETGSLRLKRLRRFDAVVFLSTTGDFLDRPAERALAAYVRSGGGFAGVHAAADAEYEWPFWRKLVGALFRSHPAVQEGAIDVVDRRHPATRGLPRSWVRTDEWYDFASNPRGAVHVLATLDEGSYEGGTMGPDHPIAWCREIRRGRSWYTAGGHTSESFSEPLFRAHLIGGIRWAAGTARGSCPA